MDPHALETLAPGSFHGRRLVERRYGPVSVTETLYRPGEEPAWHRHESANVFVVLSGRLGEAVESGTREHGPGTLVFHPPGTAHRTASPGSVRVLNLSFDESWLVPLGLRLELSAPVRVPVADLARRLVRELRSRDELSEIAVEGLARELLVEAARAARPPGSPPPAWLARAEEIVRSRLPETPSLTELANAVGVDRSHLARSFRRHLGRSVGELVRGERVRLALELLAEGTLGIAEVARRCGFADQSHMTRAFRTQLGTTPGRMRRSPSAHGDPSEPA